MYKLRMAPTDNNLPMYELLVPYFSTGTCKEYLKFCKNFKKVCKGQNITTGPAMFTLVRCLLKGEALMSFNNKAADITKMVENVNKCLSAVRKGIFPLCADLTQL